MQEPIDAFVVGLAERVDDLQDCEARGDLAQLAELAGDLERAGTRVGYESVAACAASARAAASERNGEETHKALVELTELAQRVRLGHRGAV